MAPPLKAASDIVDSIIAAASEKSHVPDEANRLLAKDFAVATSHLPGDVKTMLGDPKGATTMPIASMGFEGTAPVTARTPKKKIVKGAKGSVKKASAQGIRKSARKHSSIQAPSDDSDRDWVDRAESEEDRAPRSLVVTDPLEMPIIEKDIEKEKGKEEFDSIVKDYAEIKKSTDPPETREYTPLDHEYAASKGDGFYTIHKIFLEGKKAEDNVPPDVLDAIYGMWWEDAWDHLIDPPVGLDISVFILALPNRVPNSTIAQSVVNAQSALATARLCSGKLSPESREEAMATISLHGSPENILAGEICRLGKGIDYHAQKMREQTAMMTALMAKTINVVNEDQKSRRDDLLDFRMETEHQRKSLIAEVEKGVGVSDTELGASMAGGGANRAVNSTVLKVAISNVQEWTSARHPGSAACQSSKAKEGLSSIPKGGYESE
jgi:hypothetical protein